MPDHTELLGKTDAELLELAPEATHQHFKGGLYRELGIPMDSRTGNPLLGLNGEVMLLYEHLYPHERQFVVRGHDEFHGSIESEKGFPRFRPLERAQEGSDKRQESLATSARAALQLLGGDLSELDRLGLGPRKRHTRLWQAAHELINLGEWHEVRLNAINMDEKTWRAWMAKRYPRKGHMLPYEQARAGQFLIHDIHPSETDF